ncbi:hypothetical protein C8R44DRAFT_988714 [Mycena epipterygia]|nr:hypothetical protein C8R44DRAFT_988714 [Mycena epipterygia]
MEAAEAFVLLTELNSWSHATYYFVAAGCYMSLSNRDKAQEHSMRRVPDLLSRKMGGKYLPTEVLLRKMGASLGCFTSTSIPSHYYSAQLKEKQKRRGGDPARYVEYINISPADVLVVLSYTPSSLMRMYLYIWNTHQCIKDTVAEAHIKELAALTPHVVLAVPSPFLLAVNEKYVVTAEEACYACTPPRCAVRGCAQDAGLRVSTWIVGIVLFELAVTDLKEADAADKGEAGVAIEKEKEAGLGKKEWARLLVEKSDIDLSSRLDSRIALLRDEIVTKRGMVGISVEGMQKDLEKIPDNIIVPGLFKPQLL